MTKEAGASGEAAAQGDGTRKPEVPDAKLLELLVCPLTKKQLRYDAEKSELISDAARLAFPIKGGIPLMTLEAARHLDDEPR